MNLFGSLRWRLQFWYGVLLIVVLAGFGATAYEYQRGELMRRTDEELERRAGAWLRQLRAPDATARKDAPELEIADDTPAGSWYAVRWIDKGSRREASASAPADVPRPQRSEMKPAGPALRVRGDFREAVAHAGPGEYIATGRDMTKASAELRRFAWTLLAVAIVILVIGLAVGAVVTGRSLRPLERIAGTAREIARGDLNQRVAARGMDSEPRALAEVLNETFARLAEALESQRRFTADAAHELRTPVAVVLMQAQGALAVEGGDPAHREALEACERAGRRMRALTESLLRLAKAEASGEASPAQRVNLAALAREAARLVEPLAAANEASVTLDLVEVELPGDADGLGQLLVNLITNGIVHGGSKPRVEVLARREGGEVLLEVRDSGPGIPEEQIGRLFERFGRLDASRSRSTGGVGLGLAISRAIVEAHGGRISAGNRVGGGAIFSVALPAG